MITNSLSPATFRHYILLVGLTVLFLTLLARVVDLQYFEKEYYAGKERKRFVKQIVTDFKRGKIRDQNGSLLASSIILNTLIVDPRIFNARLSEMTDQIARGLSIYHVDPRESIWHGLAKVSGLSVAKLQAEFEKRKDMRYWQIKRQMDPKTQKEYLSFMAEIRGLITSDSNKLHSYQSTERYAAKNFGLYLRPEPRRFYPLKEMISPVLGLVNRDHHGQEGIELSLENRLAAKKGVTKAIFDGRSVANPQLIQTIEEVESGRNGEDIILTIDSHLQRIAYGAIHKQVERVGGTYGTLVMLDARNGGVLAMVNTPSYNPNSQTDRDHARMRNRAIADVFEPGSTGKTFIMAMALEGRHVALDSQFDMKGGKMAVGDDWVQDFRDYGNLNFPEVLIRSSNIGAAQIASAIPREKIIPGLAQFGFGIETRINLPGEARGELSKLSYWSKIDHATFGFGYGYSTTLLQLARAYSVFANHGSLLPISILKSKNKSSGQRVLSDSVRSKMVEILEGVTRPPGTATKAQTTSYRVAGKTGTARKRDSAGSYVEDQIQAIFVGFAPATDPRLIIALLIDDPQIENASASNVAAPVFSHVMEASLRHLKVPSDRVSI